jgi:hypothetical protein
MVKAHRTPPKYRPGDLYEDCSYHPCLCLGSADGAVWGISLVDGSYPRSCDIGPCGIRKLTLEEAWLIRRAGPRDAGVRRRISKDKRWWPTKGKGRAAV